MGSTVDSENLVTYKAKIILVDNSRSARIRINPRDGNAESISQYLTSYKFEKNTGNGSSNLHLIEFKFPKEKADEFAKKFQIRVRMVYGYKSFDWEISSEKK